jgi:hypothetical protein
MQKILAIITFILMSTIMLLSIAGYNYRAFFMNMFNKEKIDAV